MKERIRRYELTDDEWESICSLFPVREAAMSQRKEVYILYGIRTSFYYCVIHLAFLVVLYYNSITCELAPELLDRQK